MSMIDKYCSKVSDLQSELENLKNINGGIIQKHENVFYEFMKDFMNNWGLQVGEDSCVFEIIEAEIYYCDTNDEVKVCLQDSRHLDPYVYLSEEQKKCGFYKHGSGMDITFGNGQFYGGILIRGVKESDKEIEDSVLGPLNVYEECFSDENKELKKIDVVELENKTNEVIARTYRVGLAIHPYDYIQDLKYLKARYRFIKYPTEIKNSNYKDKEKVKFFMAIDGLIEEKPQLQRSKTNWSRDFKNIANQIRKQKQ